MAVITIRKHRSENEVVFEVDDFSAYADALKRTGIEAPKAQYRITIPKVISDEMLRGDIDIDEQIALFFRLGPASGLQYQILDQQ